MALQEGRVLHPRVERDQLIPPKRFNIMDLHFQPKSSRLIVFRCSDQFQVWEYSKTEKDAKTSLPQVAITASWQTEKLGDAAYYIPELKKLVYGGVGESVYQVGDGIPEKVLIANCSRVSSLLYDSTRQVLLSGHTNGIIQQHKLSGELLAVSRHAGVPILPSSNSMDVTKLALSPDGRNLISGNVEGELQIWDARDLSSIGTIQAANGKGKISDICFSNNGKRLMFHQVVQEGAEHSGIHVLDLE